MKTYSQNRNTPSRNFYINELKKSPENLKNTQGKLDFLEDNLEKLLNYSFRFFHPFFNDEEYETNKNNYKANNDVDEDFDQTIEKHLPLWLTKVIAFLVAIYNKIMGVETVQKIIAKTQQVFIYLKNKTIVLIKLKTVKFFAFKSPP